MDPGTALSVLSLAIQVANGIQDYLKLWKNCEQDVSELRASIERITSIWEHLKLKLQHPGLEQSLVSTICLNIKRGEEKVVELNSILKKFEKEGTPTGIFEKLKVSSRRALYPFRASTISRISEIIEDVNDDMRLALEILSLDTNSDTNEKLTALVDFVDAARQELGGLKQTFETEAKISQRARIFDWLNPPDHTSSHNSALEKRHPGTGNWFLGSQAFETWKLQPGSRLWLYGSTGCGKSTLCSAIIENLKEYVTRNNTHEQPSNLAYFYFSFDNAVGQDVSNVIKSILWQICANGDIPSELQLLFNEKYLARPSPSDLHTRLKMILKGLGRKADSSIDAHSSSPKYGVTYLVFDGLDEIPHGPQREAILELLCDISTMPNSEDIHILVTSRPERDIACYLPSFGAWQHCPMGRRDVQNDIAVYISGQISSNPKLSKLPNHIQSKIRQMLLQGSNGMFRWAALQVHELRRLKILRPYDVLKILETLPKDLDATYDRILARLDSRLQQEAYAALEWLTFARRPLYIEMLAEAAIIDPKLEEVINPDRRIEPQDIAELLSGLVTVDPEIEDGSRFEYSKHVISLAHFSVQEYLTSRNKRSETSSSWNLEATVAHKHIMRGCVAYVRYCYKAANASLHKFDSLQSYCMDLWAKHGTFVSGEGNWDAWKAVLETFSDPMVVCYWMSNGEVFWTMEHSGFDMISWENGKAVRRFQHTNSKKLSIESSRLSESSYAKASASEFPELARYYLLYHCVIHKLHTASQMLIATTNTPLALHPYGSILEAAVLSKDVKTVKSLLEHGADFGKSLYGALIQRDEDIADELLSWGCKVELDELEKAARLSSSRLLRRVVRSVPRFDLRHNVLALDAAVYSKKGAFETLLDISFQQNSLDECLKRRSSNFEQLVLKACEMRLPDTVERLSQFENPKTFHCDYNKALRRAVTFHHAAVVKVLLNTQVKSKITYKTFSKALRWTVRKHKYKLLQTFLWHIPVGNKIASPMLRVAIASGDKDFTLRLLADGAGLDESGKWVDDVALLAAVLMQENAVVNLLMSRSVDFFICEALADGRIVREVCEILSVYGAKFAIHSITSAELRSTTDQQNLVTESLKKRLMDMHLGMFLWTQLGLASLACTPQAGTCIWSQSGKCP